METENDNILPVDENVTTDESNKLQLSTILSILM